MFSERDADDTKSIQEMKQVRCLSFGSHPLQADSPGRLADINITFFLFSVCVQMNTHELMAHML